MSESPLSSNEMVVLKIAAAGERMIPIGHWKDAIESLVRRGFLKPTPGHGDPTGDFNNMITEAGRVALGVVKRQDDDSFHDLVTAQSKLVSAQKQAVDKVQEAARLLADAGEISETALGHARDWAIKQWGQQLIERAIELSKQGGSNERDTGNDERHRLGHQTDA